MSVNPYQPPALIEAGDYAAELSQLDDLAVVEFSGAPQRDHLNRLLEKYNHVGLPTMVWVSSFCAILTLFSVASGWLAAQLVVAGLCLIAVTACIVSTKMYRRAMFQSANPHWLLPVRGEITSDGVLIERAHGSVLLHWNCLETVVANRDVVGLLTPASIGESVVVGDTMVNSESEFAHLKRAAELVSRKVVTAGTAQQRGNTVVSLMKAADRQRRIEVPAGAIAFSGPITMADMQVIDQVLPRVRRRRSVPATIVFSLLMVSWLLIALGVVVALTGVSEIAGIAIFFVIPIVGLLWLGRSQYRNQKESDLTAMDSLHHLVAFADQDGITLDAFAIVTQLPWSHLRFLANGDDRLMFKHSHSQRVVTARRDMFASEQDWNAMQNLAVQVGGNDGRRDSS